VSIKRAEARGAKRSAQIAAKGSDCESDGSGRAEIAEGDEGLERTARRPRFARAARPKHALKSSYFKDYLFKEYLSL
jgi:hypothetical protein